jgi:hypothetical protein
MTRFEPKSWVVMGAGVAAVLFSAPARAKDDDVVTVREITIVGRIQKPIAAVDVSRIQPKMTLAELRQPFLDRIEKAIFRAPF